MTKFILGVAAVLLFASCEVPSNTKHVKAKVIGKHSFNPYAVEGYKHSYTYQDHPSIHEIQVTNMISAGDTVMVDNVLFLVTK